MAFEVDPAWIEAQLAKAPPMTEDEKRDLSRIFGLVYEEPSAADHPDDAVEVEDS